MGESFDHNHKKYRCCCGCVHITTGAKIIGILILIGIIANICYSFTGKADVKERLSKATVPIIIMFPVILVFIGIQNNRPEYLLPQIFLTAILEFLMILGLVFFAIGCAGFLRNDEILYFKLATLLTLITVILGWFLYIFHRCYKYLKDVAAHSASSCKA